MRRVAEAGGAIARHFENWEHAVLIALNSGLMLDGSSVADIEETSRFVLAQLGLIEEKQLRESAIATHLKTKEEAIYGATAEFEGDIPEAAETLHQFDEVLKRYY